MSDTNQKPSHKTPWEPSGLGLSRLGPAKGSGRHAIMPNSGNPASPFPYEDDAPDGLIGGPTQKKQRRRPSPWAAFWRIWMPAPAARDWRSGSWEVIHGCFGNHYRGHGRHQDSGGSQRQRKKPGL